MARHKEYPEGSDSAQLHDIVDKYGLQRFFAEVAAIANKTPSSVSGTFYAYLRRKRALPDDHKAAYLEILKGRLDPALLEHAGRPKRPELTASEREFQVEVLEALRDIQRRLSDGSEGSGS